MLLNPIIFIAMILPTTPSSTLPLPDIEGAFVQIGDEDPEIADRARDVLMRLDQSDLALLRDVLRRRGAPGPSAAAILHDVVVHVVARAQQYESDPGGRPMLGVVPRTIQNLESGEPAVAVTRCTPGMVAFRLLREGDIIESILDRPVEPMDREAFIAQIRKFRPGEIIHLRVQRAGTIVVISARLDAAPAADSNLEVEEILNRRVQAGEKYWDGAFVALIQRKEAVPTSSPARGSQPAR